MSTQHAIWLRQRQKGIGGSDAPAILGISPWATRLDVYRDKTELVADSIERENPHKSEQAMRFWRGQNLEPLIAELFALETGWDVVIPDAPIVRGIFRGNADRLVYVDEKWIPLELKSTTAYNASEWGPSGTDEVPDHVLCQVAHYMLLLDAPFSFVAVLIGGMEYRSYRIEHNARLDKIITEEGAAFWRDHVVPGIPPEPDYSHRATSDTIRNMYAGVIAGETINLSGEAFEAHLTRKQINADIKALKEQADGCRNVIWAAMGEASLGRFSDGSGYVARMTTRKGYTVEPKTFKDLRHRRKV